MPGAGIEPARPKAGDFKSPASTSSATQARALTLPGSGQLDAEEGLTPLAPGRTVLIAASPPERPDRLAAERTMLDRGTSVRCCRRPGRGALVVMRVVHGGMLPRRHRIRAKKWARLRRKRAQPQGGCGSDATAWPRRIARAYRPSVDRRTSRSTNLPKPIRRAPPSRRARRARARTAAAPPLRPPPARPACPARSSPWCPRRGG